MSKTMHALKQILADSYALLLKTQNFHWNVTGPHFISLHEMFEGQYTTLFEQVDELAERIRALGELAPGSLSEFSKLTNIEEGKANLSATDMIKGLIQSHQYLISTYQNGIEAASDEGDSVTEDMFIGFKREHEKTLWMLQSSL